MSNLTTSTNYAVREADGLTEEQWDSLVTASPGGGHALQCFSWGEFKRDWGWEPLRLAFQKDGEAAGTAQFLLHNTLPVPGKLMYAPKGPWIDWDDPQAVRAFFDGVERIARENNVHTVKIEPEASRHEAEPRNTLERIGFHDARYDLNFADTIVMDISPSEEDLMLGMTGKSGKTTRYNIRSAARKGVTIYQPQDFEWAFEKLWVWMQDLAENKDGFHLIRPREYLHDAARRMWDAGHGRFFAASHEGETLAIAFFFDLGEKLWYMYSGSSEHKQNLSPNHLLQWEAIRWAKERGLTYYDMVSVPPPGQRDESHPAYGVYKFKKGFGGEILEFIGCMDLPVKPRQAAAWRSLEPLYYRAYTRLKNNVFY
ncbi:MAG: peptidoglycan bridge formation glycyltransferase FemA/FemB family protein [Rubrobacter sp.]|nr:peptidoglycan bridge formation glycyltransferase FemA/FemB family protein [Rubrobacter sp.]